MTDTGHRTYAVALALVVFFVTWAGVAARPWASAKPDARIAALNQREQQLQADAKIVARVVEQRQADYEAALKRRQQQIARVRARSPQTAQTVSASSPAVRIVTLPPLTITRTS